MLFRSASSKVKAEAKQLLVMTEELLEEATSKRLKAVENKLSEVSKAVKSLKDLL